MYRPAGPTQKISKPAYVEIRGIHRTLPMIPAMSMDPDNDMFALPAEAGDGIYFRIWEKQS